MRRLVSVVLLSVVLSACAGSGKINWDHARALKPGMNQKEVTALLGDPYSVTTKGAGEVRWVWVHVNAFSGTQTVALTFKDGKLAEVPQIPDSFK